MYYCFDDGLTLFTGVRRQHSDFKERFQRQKKELLAETQKNAELTQELEMKNVEMNAAIEAASAEAATAADVAAATMAEPEPDEAEAMRKFLITKKLMKEFKKQQKKSGGGK